MIKKIYAIVSNKDFYLFRKKAYSEQRTLGDALTALVLAYAKGEIHLKQRSTDKKEKAQENKYLEDHKVVEA